MKISLIPLLAALCAAAVPSRSHAGGALDASLLLDDRGSDDHGNSGNSGKGDDTEKPEKPEKPEKSEKPEKPEKPERPDDNGNKTPDKTALENLKADFRAKAEEYQRKQKELLEKLKNATAEERGKIRDEIKELKSKFKDLREELGEKIAELKPKIDRETIDDAREHGRPRNK
jgi:hypothetical protein